MDPDSAKQFGILMFMIHDSFVGAPTQILPHLYLGSSADARNHKLMDSLNIGWILNTADECGKLYNHEVPNLLKIFIVRRM